MSKEKSMQELYEQYIAECEYTTRLRPESIRGYKAVFKLFIQLMPEVTSPRFLNSEMVVLFFKRLQERTRKVGRDTYKKGVRDTTILTYWNKLSAFFAWLHRKGYINEHPFHKLKPPRIDDTDSKHLTDEAVRKIYNAILSCSKNSLIKNRDIAMVSTLFYCGLRLGEFISLELLDIDFERQTLIVRGITSKSKRNREIPIHPALKLHLTEYLTERKKRGYKTSSLFVSANSDRGLTKEGLKHWVKTLNTKSRVHFHLHQFRHTFAHNLAVNDVNATKIQQLLGHSSLNMTMKYLGNISNSDLAESIKKLSVI
jgi:site-specific recombinase XerD